VQACLCYSTAGVQFYELLEESTLVLNCEFKTKNKITVIELCILVMMLLSLFTKKHVPQPTGTCHHSGKTE